MSLTYDRVRWEFERAVALAEETMRAQSERVGPSLLDMLTSDQLAEANMYPTRDTATNAAMLDRQLDRLMFLTPEEMQARYPYSTTRQPERPPQAERRGQMTFSTKQPPLTPAEKGAIKEFFKKCLKDGYAAYPLSNRRIPIYWDGEYKFIHTNRTWSASGDYFYIGYGKDNGDGDGIFGSPANRLAFVVALMSACDMAGDAELQPLVEERLSKILVGVYASAVAPLAERSNKEPVSRIAWSAAGGVAAFVDGEWVTPVTGESVEVGEGWVVVETGEGTMSTTPPVATSPNLGGREIFERLCNAARFYTESLPDGREWAPYGVEDETRQRVLRAEQNGFPGLIAEQLLDGRWGITYPLAPTASSTEPTSEPELMPF